MIGSDLVGEGATEFLRPLPDGLVRDSDPTGSQQVLNHSQAQRETEIEPNRMGDDLTGIAMPTVKRISICHAPSSHSGLHIPLSLRCRGRKSLGYKRYNPAGVILLLLGH